MTYDLSCDITNGVNTKNCNYYNKRQQYNNINFCSKNDTFVKKTVTTKKTSFLNLFNKIKLLFKNKQNIENILCLWVVFLIVAI